MHENMDCWFYDFSFVLRISKIQAPEQIGFECLSILPTYLLDMNVQCGLWFQFIAQQNAIISCMEFLQEVKFWMYAV